MKFTTAATADGLRLLTSLLVIGSASSMSSYRERRLANVTVAPENDNTQFHHFLAHNMTRTCSADNHATPFNNQIRGVNLGSWMVLEPWITPSMFYQFLGGDETNTAMDMYSFCEILGPEEGNKQLRRHWETWVTEELIEELAQSGAVNSLRLPVGDWMYKPYGPYIGCTDGALDYVDDLLDWAHARGLTVLFDIHGVKGSQNGFDNSGQSQDFEWTSALNTEPAGLVTFQHWGIRSAAWMGEFDRETIEYTSTNYENIEHALETIQEIVNMYKGHPAVLGLEPVNEPWQYTPIEELKQYYWEGYLIVKKDAPYWKYIMHDSFRFDVETWGGFMAGCPDRALDTHIYQAWQDPASRISFYNNACGQKSAIAKMEAAFGPVIVGEWSLATDNCAMWLNGFNDNLSGFPRLPCKFVKCADPYMGTEQPGTPVDPGKPMQGPYGTGMSGPSFGLCPVDRDWMKERNIETGTDWMRAPPEAPRHLDATDEVMTALARKKISAFSGIGHGFYFWNFRTELDTPQWSYMLALERGWISKGNLNDDRILHACHKEDEGLFVCMSTRQTESSTKGGMKYALGVEGVNSTYVDSLSGDALFDAADIVFSKFWEEHKGEGATCDFGGAAQLQEFNKTYDDDDDYYKDDDAHYFTKEEARTSLLILTTFGILVGGCFGFLMAMAFNEKFSNKVSRSSVVRRVTRRFTSHSGSNVRYTEIPEQQY
mmetsp:Transcript_27909/g.41146  ORF Transcript_27909/g.41146 Transcript_27909/m.41146 type:complete len:713 (-) Transcript_27909:426-2564(-)